MRYVVRFTIFLAMLYLLVVPATLACLLYHFMLYPLWMFEWHPKPWCWTDRVLHEWVAGAVEVLQHGIKEDEEPLFYENWANGLTIEEMHDKLEKHKDEYRTWRNANPNASHWND